MNLELDHQSSPILFFHTFPEGDSLRANFSPHILGLFRTEADAKQGRQYLFNSVKVFFFIIIFYHLLVVVVCKWDYEESIADGFLKCTSGTALPNLGVTLFWLMGEDFHLQSVVLYDAKVQLPCI